MEVVYHYHSPLGGITLSSDGEALTGLWFDGQKSVGSSLPCGSGDASLPVFEQTERWLARYFSGSEPDFMPPLCPRGTPFRLAVWELLRAIPYGQTVSYGRIAAMLAARRGLPRMSAQAVGGAVGHNPISILIPCHRVIGADGSLVGYAGGLERKLSLLRLEGVDMGALTLPRRGTAL